MIIAIASGKGGTGKTTVAASLIKSIRHGTFIDCDVEEPNGHLMLNPINVDSQIVMKEIPSIDYQKCTFCGKCVEVCEFNALINIGSEILVFDEMCHSCGACKYFCPENAIGEIEKPIGMIHKGKVSESINFVDGFLNIGEASAVPVINKVKKFINEKDLNIIDSPPGTSCSMVETVRGSDYCILVTESSPFGLNDLKLAVDVLSKINVPFGVVINKFDPEFKPMLDFLDTNKIDLLMKIPFDQKIAEGYSIGNLPIEIYPNLKLEMQDLLNNISEKLELSYEH